MLNEKSFIDKDLNLLILLVTLYDEQSTSKTAERLFVTQSAISKGLRKLREQL
ncbi:LysR family transcriptional regulator, partial [Vibrio parahaemolyticus]|nr:LysR family transcriptional regulator [Vibrio parahaemolyticus]